MIGRESAPPGGRRRRSGPDTETHGWQASWTKASQPLVADSRLWTCFRAPSTTSQCTPGDKHIQHAEIGAKAHRTSCQAQRNLVRAATGRAAGRVLGLARTDFWLFFCFFFLFFFLSILPWGGSPELPGAGSRRFSRRRQWATVLYGSRRISTRTYPMHVVRPSRRGCNGEDILAVVEQHITHYYPLSSRAIRHGRCKGGAPIRLVLIGRRSFLPGTPAAIQASGGGP